MTKAQTKRMNEILSRYDAKDINRWVEMVKKGLEQGGRA
jgi:hypothetical protein